jgi:pimeloyl-ACP methyl ester carboxylesterase
VFINVNGISLFYEATGQGQPLLLLHGNSEDHLIFNPLADKLSKDFTVYAIDSRNHGQSQKTEVFTYEAMAEDIHQFIKQLDLGQVNIVGFSDGAIISLLLALNFPGEIKKMALLGPNLKPDDIAEEGLTWIRELVATGNFPLLEMVFSQPNIEASSLKAIDVPSIVIGGEKDIVKLEALNLIAQSLQNSKLKILKGQDHTSYIVDSDYLYPDLLEFLQ